MTTPKEELEKAVEAYRKALRLPKRSKKEVESQA